MKMFNLINVMDPDISIMLTGVDNVGRKYAFNFETNKFKQDNLFAKDRLITVREFRHTKTYRRYMAANMPTFFLINTTTVQSLEGVQTKNDKFVVIEVNIDPTHRAIKAAAKRAANAPNPNSKNAKRKYYGGPGKGKFTPVRRVHEPTPTTN